MRASRVSLDNVCIVFSLFCRIQAAAVHNPADKPREDVPPGTKEDNADGAADEKGEPYPGEALVNENVELVHCCCGFKSFGRHENNA